jgi:teichuronic acid biosynthesis glycosyltransferase TuaG
LLVSIIMPAYNAQRYIAESIESVLSQSYSNWELIIVNDASTDDTKLICSNYSKIDSRIKLINLKTNSGITKARNLAINHSSGRFIAFLDSDDLWKVEKLEQQINFMLEKNIYFSFTRYDLIDSYGKSLNKTITVQDEVDFQQLLKYNPIGCLTVIIDLKYVEKFQMANIRHEDYATWLSIVRDNNISAYGLDKSLANYRRTSSSISSNKFKTLLWTYKIYRYHLRKSIFKSVLYLLRFVYFTLKKYK